MHIWAREYCCETDFEMQTYTLIRVKDWSEGKWSESCDTPHGMIFNQPRLCPTCPIIAPYHHYNPFYNCNMRPSLISSWSPCLFDKTPALTKPNCGGTIRYGFALHYHFVVSVSVLKPTAPAVLARDSSLTFFVIIFFLVSRMYIWYVWEWITVEIQAKCNHSSTVPDFCNPCKLYNK